MRTTSSVGAIGLAVVVVVVATACGGDELAERIIEDRIEAESGGDLDVDLDSDGGSFSIETEDGAMTFDADGDGGVSIEGVDGEGGEFSVESEDGVTVIETEDGDATITSGGGDLPDGFPADIALPADLEILLSQSADMGGGQQGQLVAGSAPGGWQGHSDTLIASLEENGYEQQQLTTTPAGVIFSYRKGDVAVFGNVGEGGSPDETTISVQVGTDG